MDGEDPYPYAEMSGLFKHVPENKQEQYLIDFRNVIDHYLKTSSYEVEGVALEIKQLRKISKDWWN